MSRPELSGVHHVKIPVTALGRAAEGCRGFDPVGFGVQSPPLDGSSHLCLRGG
ncbi:hypothetical protein [Actinomadura sp. 9N407]|uniref:hypothetical protein n=1 Tax=Actinomadura sp. 9N407 TaxID=3375154 RepID=UPI003787643E